MKRIILFALALAALQVSITETHALSLPITTESLIERSSLIIHGKVKSKEYVKQGFDFYVNGEVSNEAFVYTKYKINIVDVISGDHTPSEITIYAPGGKHEGSIYESTIDYRLNLEEDVVFFLEYDKLNNIYWPVEQSQGVFSARRENGEILLYQKNKDGYVASDGNIKGSSELNLRINMTDLKSALKK